MNTFVAFSALLAVVSASPLILTQAPLLIRAGYPSSQYHSQDGIGQYAYGYNDQLSSKQEVKSLDGVTRGSYSYIDSNNNLQTVDYIADAGGFRVAATNLPKPVEAPLVVPAQDVPKQVEDTLEVAAAKSAHFAAIEEAKKQNYGYQASEVLIPAQLIKLPQPVEDTPEVAAARAQHLAAIEEAKKQNPQGVILVQAPIELPRPVEDTPEVAKAKAEHLVAVENAKLRNAYQQQIDNGIPVVQSAALPLVALPYSSLPLSSGGFSYSSSVLNAPVVQYVRYL